MLIERRRPATLEARPRTAAAGAARGAALVETRLVLLTLSEEVDRLVHGESG
jgi:hypothetical protein